MAQRSSRKRRKERRRSARPADGGPPPSTEPDVARGYARQRAKDDAARAALRPLAPGERPKAVIAAAIVALVFALSNLIAYLAGQEIGGQRPALVGILAFTGLMLAAAWGCFTMRYWAVLGMQALLGLIIVLFSLFLIRAGSVVELLIALAVVGSAGTLFWSLVQSLARIQMPERPGARDGR